MIQNQKTIAQGTRHPPSHTGQVLANRLQTRRNGHRLIPSGRSFRFGSTTRVSYAPLPSTQLIATPGLARAVKEFRRVAIPADAIARAIGFAIEEVGSVIPTRRPQFMVAQVAQLRD